MKYKEQIQQFSDNYPEINKFEILKILVDFDKKGIYDKSIIAQTIEEKVKK